jgi:heptosyltransferase II
MPISQTRPQLFTTPQELSESQNFLLKHGISLSNKILGINSGAAYGSAKCWPPDRFKTLTNKLLEKTDFSIIYFGDHKGAPLIDEICANMPKRVLNLAGKTSLRQLMALITCCSLLLTNDSGPMHIAAALKIPLIALFGSTNEVATGPYQHGTVIHKHVSCSPCYLRTCPIDFRCMKQINVVEVYDLITNFFKN